MKENMKTYLIEFISGFAFLKQNESRILTRIKKYGGKDTLSEQESLEFVRDGKIFYRSLRINFIGAMSSFIIVLAGTISVVVAALLEPSMVPWAFGLLGVYILSHILIALLLRKTHSGGLLSP